MNKQQKQKLTLLEDAVASFFCRTVSKQEQLRREARLKEQIKLPFTPVFRFAVASDIHINENDPQRNDRFRQLFSDAYAFSRADIKHPTLDALVLVGDLADRGAQAQYDILRAIIKEKLLPETTLITVMGNHEYGDLGTAGYLQNMDNTLDKHVVCCGFHFLGLSPLPSDTWHTPKQILWMTKELRRAVKADKDKPVFTFQHGHIWKTVYVSRSWYTQMSFLLHLVYSRYAQVINFSGHSHGPINHPLTVWQSRYTLFGTGTCNYFEMERDIGDETVPPGSENAAQFLIVEVDAQNRVRVTPYNILTHDVFRTPATTNDENLVYFIENPKDRKTYPYTAGRKKTDAAPQFTADAKASVTFDADGTPVVSFDQAQSDVCVYGYRVRVFDEAHPRKCILKKELYSEYYFEPMPQTLSCALPGLAAGKRYRVTITPLNVWRKEGEPLQILFTHTTA